MAANRKVTKGNRKPFKRRVRKKVAIWLRRSGKSVYKDKEFKTDFFNELINTPFSDGRTMIDKMRDVRNLNRKKDSKLFAPGEKIGPKWNLSETN